MHITFPYLHFLISLQVSEMLSKNYGLLELKWFIQLVVIMASTTVTALVRKYVFGIL